MTKYIWYIVTRNSYNEFSNYFSTEKMSHFSIIGFCILICSCLKQFTVNYMFTVIYVYIYIHNIYIYAIYIYMLFFSRQNETVQK